MYSTFPQCSLCLISAAATCLILPGASAVQQMVKRCGQGMLGLN